MKCQKCDRPATFHITEMAGGSAEQELHLCEEHAHAYLKQPDTSEEAPTTSGGLVAEKLVIGQTAEELARLDQQSCPVCGITFYEFRNQGRLGCAYDYVCFEKELEPLLLNIHGETEHKGKHPKNPPKDIEQQTKLIRLRRDMREAINEENYERASELRDEIRSIEQEASR